MEAHKKYIFQGAEENIKKAQTEQTKWYNLRNGAGTPFEVSQYVLQYSHHELLRKSKLHARFLGSYKLITRCSTGNWYLLDHWGHRLSKSVPSNYLVQFYTNKKYKTKDGKILGLEENDSSDGDVSQSFLSDAKVYNDVEMDNSNAPDSCSRATEYVSSRPKTSTPIKLKQVLIVTGDEMPVSSDESATIDIISTSEKGFNNPWGNMDVNEIPIEIVSDLNDTADDVKSVALEGVYKAPPTYFNPLTDADHKLAALKFNLIIDPFKQHYAGTCLKVCKLDADCG